MKIPTTFKKNLAKSASAGTGKTFNLAVRYISILLLGGKVEEIFALTFTKKATFEMENRIQSIIMTPTKHKEEIKAIAETIDRKFSTAMNKIYKLRKTFILSESHISTIDSFTSSILRSFSSQAEVSPVFEVGQLSEQIEVSAFITFLKERKELDLLVSFSDVTDDKLAGVVEGFKMLNSIEKEIEGVMSNFLIKASQENPYVSLERTEERIPLLVARMKNQLENTGNANNKMIGTITFETIKDLSKKSFISKDSLDYSTYRKAYTPDLDETFNELKKELREWFEARETLFITKLMELYGTFKEATGEAKKEKGILSFNDITNKTVDAMKDEDLEYLRFKLDSSMRHLLVDEFQDTSWAQAEILRPIIEEITQQEDSDFRSFFFVGDVKQAIYRFRGGNVQLFQKMIDDMNMEVETLNTNFRSTKELVDFTNAMFMPQYEIYPKQIANRKDEGAVSIFSTDNPFAEIGDKIKSSIEAGVKPKDMAVLVFTNKEVLDAEIEIRRINENVEIVTDTSSKILQNQEVSAIVDLLKYQQTGEEFYLTSFYSMRGEEVKRDMDFTEIKKVFSELGAFLDFPSKYIKSLVDKLDMFNGELNIIKFIEIVSKFNSVEEMYMNLDTITESVLNPEDANGIRILTIHKAKGLEFENVFILDRKNVGGKNHKQLFFEFDESAEIKAVWHNFSKRELVDSSYASALDQEKLKEHNDDLNVLYVALTRAGKELTILRYPEKSKLSIINDLPIEK